MSRRFAPYAVVAAAAALPRLVVLLYERGDILTKFTEKSDDFARTFVHSGTFGLVPDVPSAYTQPLYGFFLVPIYETVGRHWATVGLAQTAVAVVTALLVLALGRRILSERAAVVAALATTLSPYLVWHDVHVNREVLDGLIAPALVLLALALAERGSLRVAAAAGAVSAVALLGNSRLAALPLLLLGWVAWRRGLGRHFAAISLVLLAAGVLVLSPWLVRNRVQLGCWALTTDSRALWKANNMQTYGILASGKWIDAVKDPPGLAMSPQGVEREYERTGRIVPFDECAFMRDYRRLVTDFWRDHPGEKAKLAAQATLMLWQPQVTATEGRPGAGSFLDTGRAVAQPAYTGVLYVFAVAGLFLVGRAFATLAVALLAYQTLAAMLFVGATRYRVPWDFVIALLAAPALVRAAGYVRARVRR